MNSPHIQYIYIYATRRLTFQLLLHRVVEKGTALFPILQLTVDLYLIRLLCKDYLLSFWYDLTWDWTSFNQAIDEHKPLCQWARTREPDYHSWWISKMQSGREDTLQERSAIKFCFKLGTNTPETYGMLQTSFRPSCMNRVSVFEWHKRYKEGRGSVREDERCGRSKEVNTP